MDSTDWIKQAALVRPSPRQLAWQRMEFYSFIHFGVNTFTDCEWGLGTEDPAIFNPTQLDARQWVAAFKAAGMRGAILTAKHHDGFCLWPSRFTDHSVKHSPWKNGKGDVVGELAKACHEAGLKLGLYLSPWDRHEQSYGNSPRYNAYFLHQLTELLTQYGELFCLWFDGACGEGPNGKRQVYDWEAYYRRIRELQPNAVISVMGPDVRWCGNEAGKVRESEWSVVPAEMFDQERIAGDSQQTDEGRFAERLEMWTPDLGSRERIRQAKGLIWYPAETNTSIRPGWFYHKSEDEQVRSLDNLVDLYFSAVGGNSTLLLNLPPDRRGLIHETDVARLKELGNFIRRIFQTNLALGAKVSASSTQAAGNPLIAAEHIVDGKDETYWAAEAGVEQAELVIDLDEAKAFDIIRLQEQIEEGQRIEQCAIDVQTGSGWEEIARATTVGYQRLLRFPLVSAQRVRLRILGARYSPTIKFIGLYKIYDNPSHKPGG